MSVVTVFSERGDQLLHMRGCFYSRAFYFLDGQNDCFSILLAAVILLILAPPASIWQVNVASNMLVCILTSLQGAFNCVTLMDWASVIENHPNFACQGMVWKVVFLLLPSVFSENERSRGRGGQTVVLYHCGSFFSASAPLKITGSVVAFCESKPDLEGTEDLGDVGLTLASS